MPRYQTPEFPPSPMRSSALQQFAFYCGTLATLFFCGPVLADNVDVLVEQYRIADDLRAQHEQCLAGAAQSLEMDLEAGRQSDDYDIEPGDPDWALIGAIYSEYYTALCDYLTGDEILNFYRAEIRKRFTAAEIDSLIEFNNTPLGQKVNDEWFNINQVYGDILNQRQLVDGFEAQQRFEDRMDDFWDYRQNKAIGKSPEQDA
jgi:hypothetical protein